MTENILNINANVKVSVKFCVCKLHENTRRENKDIYTEYGAQWFVLSFTPRPLYPWWKTSVAFNYEPIFTFRTRRKPLVFTGNLTPDHPVHSQVTLTILSVSAMKIK